MGSNVKYAVTGLKSSNLLIKIGKLFESMGIAHDWKGLRKQILLRNPIDYISYADEEKKIGVCIFCQEKFKVTELNAKDFKLSRECGLCPDCVKQYMEFRKIEEKLLEVGHKSTDLFAHISDVDGRPTLSGRVSVKDGHRVGERFRKVFVEAVVNNPNFTIDMFNDFCDTAYCREVLKFSSYPMIVDVTNVSDTEIKEDKDFYGHYGLTEYHVLGRIIRLTNHIYEKNFIVCILEFKRLGLITQDFGIFKTSEEKRDFVTAKTDDELIITLYNVENFSPKQIQTALARIGGSDVKVRRIFSKKFIDYIDYADEEKTVGVCKYCAGEFEVNELTEADFKICSKFGLCPNCAKRYLEFRKIDFVLKQKKAKTATKRIVINGGQSVGKRLRAAFVDAIRSPNLTKEIISFWTDEFFYDEDNWSLDDNGSGYSRVYLHFSSYPFLIDVTDISEEELKERKDYYARFGKKRYQIFGRTYRMCGQIYEKNFIACIAEFKRLGLIPQDAEY